VTQVNEALLAGKPVKFVGTATAGTDHIDENWLQQATMPTVRSRSWKPSRSANSSKDEKTYSTTAMALQPGDENWLQQAGIAFSAAPGCNAIAVVEYVFSSLLLLLEAVTFRQQQQRREDILHHRDGVAAGRGGKSNANVGGRLQKRLAAWGVKTLLCDPPRADRGDEGDFLSVLGFSAISNAASARCQLL
jgi:erythronate-4-phosphate dehydrogenase